MTRRPTIPTEPELRAMVSQGRRDLKSMKSAVRGALINGAATGSIRHQISELRGRLAGWESAIGEIAAQDARVIADRVATIHTKVAVDTVGAISDRLMALQAPSHPTIQGAQL